MCNLLWYLLNFDENKINVGRLLHYMMIHKIYMMLIMINSVEKNIIFVYVYDKRKKWQKSIFIIIIFMCYKNSIFLWVGSGKTFRRLVSIIFIAKDFILFILYNFHINLFSVYFFILVFLPSFGNSFGKTFS